jgi:hypothetical protein
VGVASVQASAIAAAALTTGLGRNEDKAKSLHRFLFAAGGQVHGGGLALLVGALGLAGLRTGVLPRPLAIAALASAGVNALAPLVGGTKGGAGNPRRKVPNLRHPGDCRIPTRPGP